MTTAVTTRPERPAAGSPWLRTRDPEPGTPSTLGATMTADGVNVQRLRASGRPRSTCCCSHRSTTWRPTRVVTLDPAGQPDRRLLARPRRGRSVRGSCTATPPTGHGRRRTGLRFDSARRCSSIRTVEASPCRAAIDGWTRATRATACRHEERRRRLSATTTGRAIGRSGGRSATRSSTRRTSPGSRPIPARGSRRGPARHVRRVHRQDPVPRRPRDHRGRAAAGLPVRPLAAPAGLVNYWGYQPVSFFAPHAAYASRRGADGRRSTSSATSSRRSIGPASRSSSMSSTTTPPRSARTDRRSASAGWPTTTTTCSTPIPVALHRRQRHRQHAQRERRRSSAG